MKKVGILFLFLAVGLAGYSQFDTEFWFAVPYANPNADENHYRFVFTTSSQSSDITIQIPANSAFTPITFNIPANSSYIFNFSSPVDYYSFIISQNANTTLNTGIKITATNPVFCYYELYSTRTLFSNTDLYPLKGEKALGTHFLIPFQKYFNSHPTFYPLSKASFYVIATEDNTTVTINPTKNIEGHAANIPFTVNLNQGQVYYAKAVSSSAVDRPAGSEVVSNKNIAIVVDDDLMYLNGCADVGGDQIVPVAILGTKYMPVRGFLYSPYDIISILAVENNTQIQVNAGTVSATLQKGETYTYTMGSAEACLIETNKPAYVTQTTGFNNEIAYSILPPIAVNCRGSDAVSVTRSVDRDFYLMILTETAHIGTFSLNGNPNIITASDFQDVPGTFGAWKYAKKSILLNQVAVGGVAKITNSTGIFHLGVIQNGGTSCEFGYFSDYGQNHNIFDTVTICQGLFYDFYGDTLTEEGNYQKRIPTINGCDTLIVLKLNIIECCQTQTVTVRFKPDSTVGQDAYISTNQSGPCTVWQNENHGNHYDIMSIDWTYNAQGCSRGTTRSLLKFVELATIPVNAIITHAELKLYGVSASDNYGNSCFPNSPYSSYCPNTSFIQRVTSNWNEKTVTWNTQPTSTTVNQITIPQTTSQWNWNFTDSSANLLAMVQDWVKNPATNFGFMMRLETENYYRSLIFASSNHSDTALHPELIVTYELKQRRNDTTIFNDTICKENTYQKNGFSVSVSGTYTQNLQNRFGCDSIVILNLTVKRFDFFPIYDTTCPNTAYNKHGFNILASELQTAGNFEFRDTIPNPTGCDSVIVLKLNILAKNITTFNETICEGEIYSKNGFNHSVSGTYTQNLQNRFGCDSTVILTLYVAAKDTVSIFDTICEGETYSQNGFNASKSGTYTQNLHNRFGCDSLVELNLIVKQIPDIEIVAITDNFCNDDYLVLQLITNGDAFLWSTGSSENPITVTKSGIYTATAFLNGCEKKAFYTLEECPCLVYIPNAFTPNSDGLNEVFKPEISCFETLKSYKMHVYDRWGNIIFQSSDYAAGWNGRDNKGGDCAMGVYNCVIQYTDSKDKKFVKNISIRLVR